jgi:hypothetical protein
MIPIYFDELAEVLKACTRLRPDECSPAQLGRLMADHLTHTNADLAKKVLAFNGVQMVALSAFVLQAQALVGMSDRSNNPVGMACEIVNVATMGDGYGRRREAAGERQ